MQQQKLLISDMNDLIYETRLLKCHLCEKRCEFYNTTAIAENCFECPLQYFNKFDCQEGLMLGDKVEIIAKPIAHFIDSVTNHILPDKYKTDIVNCPACKKRKEFLNDLTK